MPDRKSGSHDAVQGSKGGTKTKDEDADLTPRRGHSHPAVHGDSPTGVLVELFPRAGGRPRSSHHKGRPETEDCRSNLESRAKEESMRRHPAGKGLASRGVGCHKRTHVVERGETLWSIAADALGTDELHRIARYWPRIHRLNREVIGSDPNMIFPGQVLSLPEETAK
jgi:nucleoid-associated protein YgaU